MSDTCRARGCDGEPRDATEDGVDLFGAKFCSDQCEVKHDHIRADARDAEPADGRDEPEPGWWRA